MKTSLTLCILLVASPVMAEEMQSGEIQRDVQPAQQTPAQQAAEENAAPAMEEQAGFSRGSVVRHVFTTEIADREPANDIEVLSNDNGEIKYFTELRDMAGQQATHRWEHDGKVMAEIPFNVKGHRWRVWSSKKLMPEWTGEWKVSVLNGAGEVISEQSFQYQPAENTQQTMPASETVEEKKQ